MKKCYSFKKIDSTSSYLKRNYCKYDNLTFIFADFQENGHGRFNRKWISKANENLLFSVLVKDQKLINKYSSISIATAVCIYEILREVNIDNVSIKWPNDVYINDKKVAGILLEGISSGDKLDSLILGIGINVNANYFDEEISNIATSIFMETKTIITIKRFRKLVIKRILSVLDKLKKDDNSYLEIAKANNYLKGKEVYADIKGVKTLVTIIDIDNDNSLIIEKDNHRLNICSGEISFNKIDIT